MESEEEEEYAGTDLRESPPAGVEVDGLGNGQAEGSFGAR